MDTSASKVLELTTTAEWKQAFPIMNQIRTDYVEETYLDMLNIMKQDGYRLFALFVQDKIVALVGISIRVNFYNKRHVYIYDLITDASHRSLGYGEKLLDFIHNWAKEQGIDCVALESGLKRIDAHRFYEEKMNYEKWSYSFRKKL